MRNLLTKAYHQLCTKLNINLILDINFYHTQCVMYIYLSIMEFHLPIHVHTRTHTHARVYNYIYICVCVHTLI